MKYTRNSFRHSLSAKILGLVFLNISLILIVLTYSVGLIYRTGVRSFAFAPIADRILAVSRLISFDLLENDSEGWDYILAKYSAGTPLQFYLFDRKGKQIAGKPVELPASLHDWTRNIDTSLTYSPRWNYRDLPDAQRGTEVLFLKHEGNPGYYWAATHVLMHYTEIGMYGHATLVWRFSRLWTNSYFVNVWPYVGMISAVLVVTLLCWTPAIRGLLSSLSRLTTASSEIAQGNFQVDLPTSRLDEIGQLGRSLDGMAKQLAGLLDQQRRFVSDAAHELCSPASRMQVLLAIIEQQKSLQSCMPYIDDLKEETQLMSALVNDLLTFSKTEFGVWNAPFEEIEVGGLISSAIRQESIEPQAITQSVEQGMIVFGISSLITRAIANLLRNAMKYAGAYGPIEVVGKTVADEIVIEVNDHGPGLNPEDLERIFLPFYRPEFARTRDTGGTGLGLAIVKNCVEACRGTVRCRSRKPHGLSVEIRFPKAIADNISHLPQATSLS